MQHYQPLPSLLDRLAEPEAAGRGSFSASRLRDIIRRDLAWLLNTGNLDGVQDLKDFPQVADSVVNYGIPDLTGASVANADLPALERRIRRAIVRFEPRIVEQSLQIKAHRSDAMAGSALRFDITCDIRQQDSLEFIALQFELDLETGAVASRSATS